MIDSFEFWSLIFEIYLKFGFCDFGFNWSNFNREKNPELKKLFPVTE